MIKFTRGDMFAVPADLRVNTVNCKGAMGKGVALAFKNRYPDMFKDYQKACRDGQVRPGSMHIWKNLTGDWVVNFPTKRDWREPSRYEDILSGLDALHTYLKKQGPITVALPALGCGNGGLDWERVSSMITDKLSDLDATILVFEPADSRAAGISSEREPTEDHKSELQYLGFQIIKTPSWLKEFSAFPDFVTLKGDESLLDQPWLALLTSKDPSEREYSALRSIAHQLATASHRIAIALPFMTRATSDIAEIFLQHGIAVIQFLPFGPLSRKIIARTPTNNRAAPFAIVSIAAPSSAWSRSALAKTMACLRAGTSVALLSDPTPEWLQGGGISNWSEKRIFFIRYGELSDGLCQQLHRHGARPIGRRPDTGEPNLAPLLEASNSTNSSQANSEEALKNTPKNNDEERLAQLVALDEDILKGGLALSEWCSFIIREADMAFVKGAYLASILTAVSGIEAFLKAESGGGLNSRLSDLIQDADLPPPLKADLHKLRNYRNKWVHIEEPLDDSKALENPNEFKLELEEMALFAANVLRRTIHSKQCV